MYDENKWNEVNNENEKKNNEQPINTQNTQNTQTEPSSLRVSIQEDRSTEDLVPVHRTASRITEIRMGRARMVPTTADSSISSTTATRTSTRTRISSTIIIRDMDRTRMETVTAITPQRRIHT